MDPLSPKTVELFKKNKLAGHFNYVRPGEVVPHFFSRGSYFLSHDEENHELKGTVNSCLHRGFKLVPQRTQMKPGQNIGCKFHNWSYDQKGTLLSTPGFDKPVSGCLQNVALTDVHYSLYFETETMQSLTAIKDLFTAPHLEDIWFEEYSFDQENVTFYPCNWRSFMEVYLDAYHHKHAHPTGLGMFLTDDVGWYSSEEGVVNVVGIAKDPVIKSFGWSKFSEELQKVGWDKPWGAIFMTVFPGFMVEFFPHVMVISQLVPISDKMTANYLQIYYAPEVKENFDFQNAFGDAYSETASEDGALQDLLEDGRTGKWYELSTMPVHSVMEAGIPLLETWMSRNSR
jgi:choline monooxygenase